MKRFNKLIAPFLAAVLSVGLVTGCGQPNSPATSAGSAAPGGAVEPLTLQIGHVDVPSPDNHNQYFATKFAEYCSEASNGAIEVQIMSNSQLGAERDMMEGMQMGTVEMAIITNLAIGNFDSRFQIYDLPYLFADSNEAFSLIDSEIGQEIADGLYDKLGIKVLATGQGGFRQTINTKHGIESVDDFAGLKLRVPETDVYMSCFKSLGANPVPLAWNECFTALQQHTIDGLECPLSVIYTTGFADVAEYLTLTNHIFSPVVMMMSGSTWDSLDAAQQQIISEAAQKAAVDQRAFIDANDSNIVEKLEEAGMTTSYVDMEACEALVSPNWEQFREKIGADVYDQAMEFLGK